MVAPVSRVMALLRLSSVVPTSVVLFSTTLKLEEFSAVGSSVRPSFIEIAISEGRDDAVDVFTRAKLAEGYHAALYLDAYNNIDNPDDDQYFLCPACGYIHKGDDFESCPICGVSKDVFVAY